MRQLSRFAIILSIILSIGITACTASGVKSSGTSGSCENALFPVKQGAIWTYASAGGPNGSFAYTDTITEVRADGFTLTSQFAGALRAQDWLCHSDGLQALQIGGGSAAGISTQGITADLATLEVHGVSLPREMGQGAQWQYGLTMQGAMAMPGDQQSPSQGSYSVTMQELGSETITVPAGVFDAVRIQANSNMEVMTDFQGVPIPVKYNGVTLLWYAPGVGFVKSVENGDFSGTVFSITTELQSYNIP
ncbi:MAG: hypothetical protein PHQ36_03980 [Anaerolineales bacterium]|nr:hypothetical protein [Anaerolineales bacterium]